MNIWRNGKIQMIMVCIMTPEISIFFSISVKKTRFESIGINEDQFIKFIADDKLDQARHVTRLPEIWRNPEHDPEGEVRYILEGRFI